MAVMAASGQLTRADLDALPHDGLRHELIDGAFVMTPAPGVPHQAMVAGLYRALWSAAVGTDLMVLFAPLDVVLGANVVQPDLVVAPRAAFTARELPSPPLLVVEVRSASTGWLDEGRKRTLYEEFGVASYWLVDPLAPSVTVLALREGVYQEVATARGGESIDVTEPFRITIDPGALARG